MTDTPEHPDDSRPEDESPAPRTPGNGLQVHGRFPRRADGTPDEGADDQGADEGADEGAGDDDDVVDLSDPVTPAASGLTPPERGDTDDDDDDVIELPELSLTGPDDDSSGGSSGPAKSEILISGGDPDAPRERPKVGDSGSKLRRRPPVSDVNIDISPDMMAAARQADAELNAEAPDASETVSEAELDAAAATEESKDLLADLDLGGGPATSPLPHLAETVVVHPPESPRTLLSLKDGASWQRPRPGSDRTLLRITPDAAWQSPVEGDETLFEIHTGGMLTPPRDRNTLLIMGSPEGGGALESDLETADATPPRTTPLADFIDASVVAPPIAARTILHDGTPDFPPVSRTEVRLMQQAEQLIQSARLAQTEWAQVPLRKRLRVVNRLRRVLYRNRLEIINAFDNHMAQTEIETVSLELLGAADQVRDIVRNAPELLGPHERWTGDHRLYAGRQILVRRAPVGVVGLAGSTTWPLSELVRTLASCLAIGNGLVVAPGVGKDLAELLITLACDPELDLPDGLVGWLPPGAESRFAIAASSVDHLIMTEADHDVRRHAHARAHTLGGMTLHLPSAPPPMIVMADADLDAAVRAAVTSSHRMVGQVPESIGRVYVEESIAAEFIQLAARAALDTRLGRMAGGYEVGPLRSLDELDRAEALINEATRSGARIVTGGRRLTGVKAPYLHATVLADCDDSMRIVWEHFAPILPVIPLPSADFDTRVVLSSNRLPVQVASIFSSDTTRATAIAEQLRAAVVSINDEPRPFLDSRIPWPAAPGLGYGSVHGPEGLLELSRAMVITRDRGELRFKPWWFPYSHAKIELARQIFRLRHAPGFFARLGAWFRLLMPGSHRDILRGDEIESLRDKKSADDADEKKTGVRMHGVTRAMRRDEMVAPTKTAPLPVVEPPAPTLEQPAVHLPDLDARDEDDPDADDTFEIVDTRPESDEDPGIEVVEPDEPLDEADDVDALDEPEPPGDDEPRQP